MTEQANVDRYVEAGMSLGRAIRRVDRTVSRAFHPMFRWGVTYLEKRHDHDRRWHT